MIKIINDIWHDPVWSKVIAAIIFALLTLLTNWIVARHKRQKFRQVFIHFWTTKFELWVFVLFLFILLVLNFELPKLGLWNYALSLVVFGVYFIFPKKKRSVVGDANQKRDSNILFKSEVAKTYHFSGSEEFNWENDKPVGDKGKGTFDFANQILNIERLNTDGRYVVKVLEYLSKNQDKTFIEKDISKGIRIINIQFQAKVIGGNHTLWFISKNPTSNKWIHKANTKIEVSSTSWKDFNIHFRIPANENFIIDIQDTEVKKAPSSIQIQNLIITEET